MIKKITESTTVKEILELLAFIEKKEDDIVYLKIFDDFSGSFVKTVDKEENAICEIDVLENYLHYVSEHEYCDDKEKIEALEGALDDFKDRFKAADQRARDFEYKYRKAIELVESLKEHLDCIGRI